MAARLGVPASTAYRWMRGAGASVESAAMKRPTFVEVVAERAQRSILVRVGVVEIEVQAGFDARLLRELADALGADT